ncbi:MAG: chloride channel protein [Muribaculaceae bacterium]|nr:chloride channel protein [Muribaculaceae bacterium]
MSDSTQNYTDANQIPDSRISTLPPKAYPGLLATCVAIGVACGIATFLIDKGISLISDSIHHFLKPEHFNIAFIFVPAVGMLLSVLYVNKMVKINLSHGSERVKEYLKTKDYNLPPRLMWASGIGTSLTLGFGGSAGAEGPSAFTGAAIAGNFGRWLKMDNESMRLLIGIGAGAGIAGIFRSPIGGVLFTLEVLRMPITTLPVLGLISASLSAGLTAYILNGSQYEVAITNGPVPELSQIPIILLLGIVCGIYSVYYSGVMSKLGSKLNNWKNPWLKALVCGLTIGVCIFLFPDLYSTGYSSLGKLLVSSNLNITSYSLFHHDRPTPELLAGIALGIIILKALAVTATNYGGGVSGNFAPALFAGGFVGFLFATLANLWFDAGLDVGNFVYMGMAGGMSGIIKAPLMAMFLTTEMSGHSRFLWPLAVVSVISWATVLLFNNRFKFSGKRVSDDNTSDS